MWNIDEGVHSTTSKDMVLSGDWITPQYNGKNFYDKPPLYNWFAAISFLVFGFTEFAARLPAALLGFGCVMITYLMGRKMFGPVVAFLSAVVLATSAEYIVLSRVVVHDISLVFFTTLALALFYLGYRDERHRKRDFLLGYAALGFAVLAKGPVGVAIPVMIIGLFLIFKRRLSFLKEMRIGWGILILLAIASPWYILISLKNPDYFEYFFVKQNLGSFISKKPQHPEPFYYYLPVLMGGLFPWSLFLPLALFRALRGSRDAHGDGVVFALIWFGIVLIFFSTASSKLGTYILPLFPAASLLVGILWYDLLTVPSRGLYQGVLYSYFPLVIIFLAALIYILLFPPIQLMADAGINLKRVYLISVWFCGCAFLSIGLVIKKKYKAFIGSMVGMVLTVFLFSLIFILPSTDPYRSSKGLAYKLDKLIKPGESIVFYRRERESVLFYTNRLAVVLKTPQQLIDFMAADRKVFCVIKMDNWEDLEILHQAAYVIAKEGDKLIISNN